MLLCIVYGRTYIVRFGLDCTNLSIVKSAPVVPEWIVLFYVCLFYQSITLIFMFYFQFLLSLVFVQCKSKEMSYNIVRSKDSFNSFFILIR